jgi:competence ComEA-like helix-hairpin-helix protein
MVGNRIRSMIRFRHTLIDLISTAHRPMNFRNCRASARRWPTALVEARPFASVDDLGRVPGFGPMTRAKVLPHVIVGDSAQTTDRSSDLVLKTAKSDQPIDPNTAKIDELQSIPGVGAKMAQRIVDERAKRPFNCLEDMRRVAGIGPKTIEKLRARVVIQPQN